MLSRKETQRFLQDHELKEILAGYLENDKPKKIIINANITGTTAENIAIGVVSLYKERRWTFSVS